MKTIGLIGGMSWESTADYYRFLNQEVRALMGGLHSAKILLSSLDFAEIEVCQKSNNWQRAANILSEAATQLERAGADCCLLCTNTMHKVADEIAAAIQIPFLHIADATAEAIRAAGFQKVLLLGTRFTMEEQFYRGRLQERFHLSIVIPDKEERELIHRVIYDELCQGIIQSASKAEFLTIIDRISQSERIEGTILGCTEIGLLIQAKDLPLPIFDTTKIHVRAAIEFAMGEG